MFEAYMRVLRKIFGETGALSAYLVLRRFGFIAVILLVIGTGVGAVYFISSRGAEMTHVGYQLAQVDRLEILDGDARFGVIANVTLPDGASLRLVASEGRVAQSVGDTACVQVMRSPNSDQLAHRLTLLSDCAAN